MGAACCTRFQGTRGDFCEGIDLRVKLGLLLLALIGTASSVAVPQVSRAPINSVWLGSEACSPREKNEGGESEPKRCNGRWSGLLCPPKAWRRLEPQSANVRLTVPKPVEVNRLHLSVLSFSQPECTPTAWLRLSAWLYCHVPNQAATFGQTAFRVRSRMQKGSTNRQRSKQGR